MSLCIGAKQLKCSDIQPCGALPFLVEDHQHGDEKADDENDGDGNKDHGVEDVFISCCDFFFIKTNTLLVCNQQSPAFICYQMMTCDMMCLTFSHIELHALCPGAVASQ